MRSKIVSRKDKIFSFIIAIVFSAAAIPIPIASADNSITLEVSDSNLFAALVEQIACLDHNDSTKTITMDISCRSSVTTLQLSNKQISDITALRFFDYAEIIYLNDNQITDLSPLRRLRYLDYLYLQNNPLTNDSLKTLEPELDFPLSLKHLFLGNNQITDYGHLSNLFSLETLSVTSSHISEIPSSILELPKLTSLYLDNNQISDVTPLESLGNLRNLSLSHNQISNAAPLYGLDLDHIQISYNQIADISFFVDNASEYESYDWSHQDFTLHFLGDTAETPFTLLHTIRNRDGALPNCTASGPYPCIDTIENASFSADYQTITITDPSSPAYIAISGGTGSTKDDHTTLKLIPSSPVHIADDNLYSALKDAIACATVDDSAQTMWLSDSCRQEATELYLDGAEITDISPLSDLLPDLTVLDLSNNQISSLPQLDLPKLKELYLYNNQLSDISPLSNLEQLTTLDLGYNQITDVTPLSQLINLDTLYLDNNQISDINHILNVISKNNTSVFLEYQDAVVEYSENEFESPSVLPFLVNQIPKHTLNNCAEDEDSIYCLEIINAAINDDFETITILDPSAPASITIYERDSDSVYLTLSFVYAPKSEGDNPKTLDNIPILLFTTTVTLLSALILIKKNQ